MLILYIKCEPFIHLERSRDKQVIISKSVYMYIEMHSTWKMSVRYSITFVYL